MRKCTLCGSEKELNKLTYIEEYKSNGFVSILNDYICTDKCTQSLEERK